MEGMNRLNRAVLFILHKDNAVIRPLLGLRHKLTVLVWDKYHISLAL